MLTLRFVSLRNSGTEQGEHRGSYAYSVGYYFYICSEWIPTTYKSQCGIVGSRFCIMINLSLESMANVIEYEQASNFCDTTVARYFNIIMS